MNKYYAILCLILLSALEGCDIRGTQNTSEASPTQALSTYVPTITPSPATLRPPHLKTECLDILPAIPTDVDVSGIFVIAEQPPSRDAYLLDAKTGSVTLLPRLAEESPTMFSVSPNRRWLAYFGENTNLANSRLIVIDSSGKQILTKAVSKSEWWGIDSWLNNDEILIDKYQSLPNISLATPLPVLVLNPFTGFEENLAGNYPNMVYLYPRVEWEVFGFSAAGYDPTLMLVAYARDDNKVVLWDIQANQEITTIRGAASFGNGPVWAPDGSRFIIDTQIRDEIIWSEELYSISSTGEQTRLTHLTDYFTEVFIRGYRWSPDGRMVAFWLATKPDVIPGLPSKNSLIPRLAVLDTETRQITSYCLEGAMVSAPVWSLNGTQLLINVRDGNSFSPVLVDIEHKISAWIARNSIPVGWMIEPP